MERGKEKSSGCTLKFYISYKRFAVLLRELTIMSRRRDNLITSPSRCSPGVISGGAIFSCPKFQDPLFELLPHGFPNQVVLKCGRK